MRLTVPHWRQQQPGECLAACAAMVLLHLGVPAAYERLKQQLDVETSSAPFFYIDRLRSWRLVVERKQGTLATMQMHLAAGRPVLVPVDTALLPYWITRPDITDAERVTDHAVVVVGLDDQFIYVNDPDFETAPQTVERDWFLEAWQHHEQWYAALHRRWAWRR
jgi:ABC-type bacteriocin/lantibiotic exporter with double-glycine peptidase domain